MPDYRVGAGIAGIYAGVCVKGKNEWKSKSYVTEEALSSAAIYLIEDTDSHIWERDINDKKKVVLSAKIVEKDAQA